MYCPNCASEVPGESAFCPDCGAPIGPAAPSVAPQPGGGQPLRARISRRLVLTAAGVAAAAVIASAVSVFAIVQPFSGDGEELGAGVPETPTPTAIAPALAPSPTASPTPAAPSPTPAPAGVVPGYAILFTATTGPGTDVFVVHPDGSDLVKLASVPELGQPQWSPDASRVAFLRGKDAFEPGGLFVVRLDGSSPTRIADPSQIGSAGRWSWNPTGDYIGVRSQGDVLYVVRADGTGVVEVAHGEPIERWDWSPDGSLIGLTISLPQHECEREGNAYLADPATGSLTPLGICATINSRDGAWSPDGQLLVAFSGGYSGAPPSIYLVSRTGETEHRIILSDRISGGLRWSPDGTKIALRLSVPDSHGGVDLAMWVMNRDGTGLRRLTEPVSDRAPGSWTWKSDSQTIVFYYKEDIYSVDMEGTGRNLTQLGSISSECFSPTGQAAIINSPLRVLDIESGVISRLHGDEPDLLSVESDCSWSPDARTVVWRANPGDTGFLLLDSETAEVIQFDIGVSVRSPTWSPVPAITTAPGITTTPTRTPALELTPALYACSEYQVQEGDTFPSIAQSFGVIFGDLLVLNGLTEEDSLFIQPGDVLYIPC